MEYRRLGRSGLKVSEIGLGGNNFGNWADEKASISIINQAMEMGINFIDTAELYSKGRSEELVGEAIKGKRSQVVIATKFGYPPNVGVSEQGGSRNYILKAVDGSLKRLKTDYIDLYYIHWPDRATPIEETLRTLDDLVRSGKVRYIGCSNFAAWHLCEALWASRLHNLEAFIAVQSRYNIIERDIEKEVAPCCQAYGVGVVPWGPLASGFLTGKYRRGEKKPAGGRLDNPPALYSGLLTEANFDKVDKLEAFAGERGHSVGELAIAWLLSRSWISSVIAGATKIEQLKANAAAADWKLTGEDAARLAELL